MEQEIQDIPQEELQQKKAMIYLLVQGSVFFISGLIFLIWPDIGMVFAAVIMALFFIADGIGRLLSTLKFGSEDKRTFWLSLGRALLQIIVGALILTKPRGFGQLGASFSIIVLGVLFVAGAVLELFRSRVVGEETNLFQTLFMLVLGAVLITVPLFSARLILRILGFVSIAGGIVMLALVWRMKNTIVK